MDIEITKSVEELVNSINPPAGVAGAESEKLLGNISEADFQNALAIATGNQFNSTTELLSALAEAKEAAQLKSQLDALKGSQNNAPALPEFANPLVGSLNELFKNNKIDEAKLYWELALTDIPSLDAMSALRTKYRLENPGLKPELINDLIKADLGITEDMDIEALPASVVAKLERERLSAVSFLEGKKLSIESAAVPPIVQQVDPAEIEAKNAVISAWGSKLIPALPTKVPISVPANQQTGAGDYSFEYNPPQELLDSVNAELSKIITSNPAAFPLTADGLAAVKDLRDKLLITANLNTFIETLVSDVYASALAISVKRNAGQEPIAPGQASPTVTPRNGNLRSVKVLDELAAKYK